nr:SDR family oxidoreductase [Streptomyces spiramenti]
MVTGMGFCLPGPDGRQTLDRADFWSTISTGAVHLGQEGVWFGSVTPPEEFVAESFPEVPDRHLANYAAVHHYGLAATSMALRDAGLGRENGELAEAAVITARATSDSWFDVYEDFVRSESEEPDPERGRALFTRLAIAGGTTDLAYVQAALLGAGGPCHTVSSGCASSAVALGDAHRLITGGVVDIAVVTGVDYFNLDRILRFQALRDRVEQAERAGRPVLPASMTLDSPMRPYDSRARASNMANGATTLILESREHARARGARSHVRVLGQVHGRVAGGSAMAADDSGQAVERAARRVLRMGGVDPQDVRYVNGGAEGNPIFHTIESAALSRLLGDRAHGLPVSVQEASFGHVGSALGLMGVAATGLMMASGQVCPTAGCEQPAEECVFDPVPGHRTAPHDLPFALSFNYHVGTGASAILLAREDEEPAVGGTAGPTAALAATPPVDPRASVPGVTPVWPARPVGEVMAVEGADRPGVADLVAGLTPLGLRAPDTAEVPDLYVVAHIGNETYGAEPGAGLDRDRVLATLTAMADRGAGRAVLVTDGAQLMEPGADPDAAARRAADRWWWQEQAHRLAGRGVVANTVTTGYAPFLGHRLAEGREAELMQHLLVRRPTRVDDLVNMVRLLATEHSAHMLGQVLTLDGGVEAMLVPPTPAWLAEPSPAHPEPAPGDPFDLSGTVLLVTGASSGIGRAFAVEAARRGAELVLVGRRADALAAAAAEVVAAGGAAHVLPADLGDPECVPAMVAEAVRLAGRVDGLVYSAGILDFDERGDNSAVRARSFAVNVLSYAATTDALLGEWVPRRHPGVVVAVGSVSALAAPVPRTQAYGASKAAMLQHTRMLATTGARWGVRANTVLPGMIRTPMEAAVPNSEAFMASLLSQVPQGRLGEPQEVAELLCFLAAPASARLSGAALVIDGGGSLGCLPELNRPRAAAGSEEQIR